MKWTLQAISSELDNQNFEIKENTILVGRHQGCDLILQSSKISRRHAAFHLKDQQLWLEDLQSSNGTRINEIQIDRLTQLESGDVIQFADLDFKVSFVDDATTHENLDNENKPTDLSEGHSVVGSNSQNKEQDDVELKQSKIEQASKLQTESNQKEQSPQQKKSSPVMTLVSCVVAIVIAFIVWAVMK